MQWDHDNSCSGDYAADPTPAIHDLAAGGVDLRMLERQVAGLEARTRRSREQHLELEALREQAVLLRARIETNRRALQLQQQLRQPTSVPAYLGQPGDY